ncbi:MAG: hypothetical protein LW630_03405 [Saprospiraceae bacterium]|jgi:hypothetical protein|nr:hypothetical protein [Saprospiraceae bacterium]
MKTHLVKFSLMLLVFSGLSLVSCNKDNDSFNDATVDAYAEEVVFRTQESTNLGRFGCYELVFPVTLSFPDGSNAEVNSYEEMKDALKTWRLDNKNVRTRPVIAFPYDVVNEDGEVITVENEADQRELRIACGKNFFGNNGPKGHNDRPKLCFKPVFPFSVSLPDGKIITLNSSEDRKVLHEAVKAYMKENPGKRIRPEFVYPITVALEDGTLVTLNSKEELKTLLESCK